jgi:hypothetical protein
MPIVNWRSFQQDDGFGVRDVIDVDERVLREIRTRLHPAIVLWNFLNLQWFGS